MFKITCATLSLIGIISLISTAPAHATYSEYVLQPAPPAVGEVGYAESLVTPPVGDVAAPIAPAPAPVVAEIAPAVSVVAPVAAPVAPAPAPVKSVASSGVNWDAVAKCESGNNWAINTGNGYEGGVQFLNSTWLSVKAPSDPPHAYQATREQQIAAAERLLARAGIGQWPVCGRRG